MISNWNFSDPTASRLVRKARAGSTSAFLELATPLVIQVYRYIYFLVPTNRIAEALTLQVFFKAWAQLAQYPIIRSSFSMWLFSIAHTQVTEYNRTHKNSSYLDNAVSVAARGGEFQPNHQLIRETVRLLATEQQQLLVLKFIAHLPEKNIARILGMSRSQVRALEIQSLYAFTRLFENGKMPPLSQTLEQILPSCLSELSSGASNLDDCLFRHPKLLTTLKPILQSALLLQSGRDVKQFSTFDSYIEEALTQHLRARQRHVISISGTAVRRTAMALSILVAAFLGTGTAYAQSAVPGDSFYSWKRASENIWLAVAPDTITVDIMLAERRMEEWIAVADSPTLGENAKKEYQEALARLTKNKNEEDMDEIVAALQSQEQILRQAGLSNPLLDVFLVEVLQGTTPEIVIPLIATQPAVTDSLEDDCPHGCNMKEIIKNSSSGVIKDKDKSAETGASGNVNTNNNKDKDKDKEDKDKDKDKTK